MTVIDTSGLVDYLLDTGAAERVAAMMASEGELAAPDHLIFETLAVLRRETHRGALAGERARSAVEDLGDAPVELYPALPLRDRAWALRSNFTVGDGLFVALAEWLSEPLATKDARLVAEARKHTSIELVALA